MPQNPPKYTISRWKIQKKDFWGGDTPVHNPPPSAQAPRSFQLVHTVLDFDPHFQIASAAPAVYKVKFIWQVYSKMYYYFNFFLNTVCCSVTTVITVMSAPLSVPGHFNIPHCKVMAWLHHHMCECKCSSYLFH